MRKFITSLLSVCFLGAGLAVANDEKVDEDKNPLSWSSKNTTATLSGFVMVVGKADFGGSVSGNDFWTALIPTDGTYANQTGIGLDAVGSRLGLDVTQKTSLGDVQGLIEIDFAGSTSLIRIRHAYLKFRGFVIGQTWSFMVDNASVVSTIDRIWIQSRPFTRLPLIGYEHSFKNGISLGGAVEVSSSEVGMDLPDITTISTAKRRYPDLPVYFQYTKGQSHIKASALVRGLSYNNLVTSQIEEKLGWGAQLSGSLKVAPKLELYAQGIYGEGIANYLSALQILNLNLMPNINNTGEVKALPMYGASAGLRVDIAKNIYSAASYSFAALSKVEDYYWDSTYRWSDLISLNMFWSPVKPILLGIEYLHGEREDMDGSRGSANRIYISALYKF
ncbi:MAG: DcaP family trimeric outer membrane transporter [Bacteroidales bacterium]